MASHCSHQSPPNVTPSPIILSLDYSRCAFDSAMDETCNKVLQRQGLQIYNQSPEPRQGYARAHSCKRSFPACE